MLIRARKPENQPKLLISYAFSHVHRLFRAVYAISRFTTVTAADLSMVLQPGSD
jgi:hypothetical protein